MPNLLPDIAFLRPGGRLIWATVLLVIFAIPLLIALRRPKSDSVTTWAQAMAGATYVFAMMLLAYAVIPSEFITFADKYLLWGTNSYIIKSTTAIPFYNSLDWPLSIDMKAIRDIVVVGIYIVFFGINIALIVLWQKRKTVAELESAPPKELGKSRFGRPLRARA